MKSANSGSAGRHRVVHIIAPSRFGGAETVVRSLAQAQMANGLDVAVMVVMDARDGSDHPFVAAAQGDGLVVDCVRVPARGYRYERSAVAERLRAIAPSVLHSHSQRTDVLHGDVVRRLGVAAVSTVHGFTGGSLRNKVYERLQRFSLRQFDGVIAVSEPLGAELRRAGLPGDRLSIIANAFALPKATLDRAGARRALDLTHELLIGAWIGRLSLETTVPVEDQQWGYYVDDQFPDVVSIPLYRGAIADLQVVAGSQTGDYAYYEIEPASHRALSHAA